MVVPIDASFIQDLLIAGEAYAGFSLRNVTVPSGVFTFWTVDSGFEQFNPVLELEVDETRVVPEPGSIVLVTTARAAACAGRRQRARQRDARVVVLVHLDAFDQALESADVGRTCAQPCTPTRTTRLSRGIERSAPRSTDGWLTRPRFTRARGFVP